MNKLDIHIKKIKLTDFSKLISLWKKSGLNINDIRIEYLELENMIKVENSCCFKLVKGKKIIGSILGTFNGRRAWIYHLAVDPKYQRLGYGSMLLKKTENILKKKGAHMVNLSVLFSNLKVAPFYEKKGYEVINNALCLSKNI